MGRGNPALILHMFFEDDLDLFFNDDDFAELAKVVSNNKTIKVLFDNQQTISDNGFNKVIGYRPQIEVMNKDITLTGIVEDSEIIIRNRKYSVTSITDEGFGTSIITLQAL